MTDMKNNDLDSEEQEILEAYESGKLSSKPGSKEATARHVQYAAATFKKDARINIRLSSKDLRSLQRKALSEGMPYQTLVSSVLHKYVEGRLTEQTT